MEIEIQIKNMIIKWKWKRMHVLRVIKCFIAQVSLSILKNGWNLEIVLDPLYINEKMIKLTCRLGDAQDMEESFSFKGDVEKISIREVLEVLYDKYLNKL